MNNKICKWIVVAASVAAGAVAGWGQNAMVDYSIDEMPVYGTLVPDAQKRYSRLPDVLKDSIRDELWQLGLNSAGISIRFASDASNIRATWTALNRFNMNHMTPTGIRGLDLYVMLDDSTWTTVGSARPSLSNHKSTSWIVRNMEPKMREYMLFLPLYDGVDSIFIGVDSLATVVFPAVKLPRRDLPVVMYGTSILQGGCATRPGMAHTNILQRMLNREVINLGFSGNARLDLEICDLMASCDASVYVLDMLPNCTLERLQSSLQPFYQRLRAARPDTPIVFVESPMFPDLRFNETSRGEIIAKNEYLRTFYDSIADENAYYFDAEHILPYDSEYTVDNAHFTDGGFMYFAQQLYPLLSRLVAESMVRRGLI